jgi:hypothetical protein
VKPQAKVSRVMREFKKGDLKSSSGQKVTNPKQAIAIGLSEAGISKKAKGGEMKESKAMMKKEVSFMKKKGAPKSMLKHEMAEMKGMKKGGNVKKMAMGGRAPLPQALNKPASMVPGRGPLPQALNKPAGGMGQLPPPSKPRVGPGNPGPMPRPVSRPPTPRPPNPGPIVNRLPTRGTGPNDAGPGRTVTGPRRPLPQAINKPSGMAKGGLAAGHKSADGIARKGKTKAEQVKMAKGGTAKMRKGGYC